MFRARGRYAGNRRRSGESADGRRARNGRDDADAGSGRAPQGAKAREANAQECLEKLQGRSEQPPLTMSVACGVPNGAHCSNSSRPGSGGIPPSCHHTHGGSGVKGFRRVRALPRTRPTGTSAPASAVHDDQDRRATRTRTSNGAEVGRSFTSVKPARRINEASVSTVRGLPCPMANR